MRIAHVLPSLAKGGAERVVVDLARLSAARGHDVTLFLGWRTDAARGIAEGLSSAVAVRTLAPDPPASKLRAATRYLHMLGWVARHQRELRAFDVVHVHLTYGSAFGAWLYLLRRLRGGRGPRVVATYHSVGIPIAAPLVPIHRALARACDALVLMAEDAHWNMRVEGGRRATALIPNGATPPDVAAITPQARADYRARHGIPVGAPLLGQVGRMHPERRPEVYLQVLERVLRDVPDAHLLLAGGGIGQDRMERLIAERGLGERAHITGPVERVAEPLAVIDVYLTINTRELTGVAAMEASLARLPVLAFQLQSDYAASDADWIWSSTDPDAIGARAVALLRDPAAREALAARQHAHAVAHHSAQGMTSAYERLYATLLDAPRGRPAAAPAADDERLSAEPGAGRGQRP